MSDVSILASQSVATQSLLILCIVISLGLALGHVKIKGLSLGTSGVLFSGLFLGAMNISMDGQLLDFIRDFGLTLFLYAIGLQTGPSFFSSFKKKGLKLNMLALGMVVLDCITTVLIVVLAKIQPSLGIGLLSGAVTSSAALGAAQQAVHTLGGDSATLANIANLGYAVAYPGGILGLILVMVVMRHVLKVNVDEEVKRLDDEEQAALPAIVYHNVEVLNQNLIGKTIEQLNKITGSGVIVTRIYHNGGQDLAAAHSVIQEGDVLHAVGTQERIDSFVAIVGRYSQLELPKMPSQIIYRRVVVTKASASGFHVGELNMEDRFGVVITRIVRSGLEFIPTKETRIHYGDRLMLVGHSQAINNAAAFLGDSVQSLEQTHLTPIFTGIALGILVGSIPFTFPSMPAPIRLGLAGGPLLVAMLLGNMGEVGPFVAYMPNPAKVLMRDLGLALFLGCVGLVSGPLLWNAIGSGDGFVWMGLAAIITIVPPIIIAMVAKKILKLDYITILGVMAGSMTDTAALAFANHLAKSDAPALSYATIYPFTLLMRVVAAQVLILWLM